MNAGALKMPMTAALPPSLLVLSDSLYLMLLVSIALVVSYLVAVWTKPSAPEPAARA